MNKFLPLGLALAFLTFAVGCSHSDHDNMEGATTTKTAMPADSTTANGVAATYTCPMHPEVLNKMPGQCPKCGMDLVKK